MKTPKPCAHPVTLMHCDDCLAFAVATSSAHARKGWKQQLAHRPEVLEHAERISRANLDLMRPSVERPKWRWAD